MVFKKYVGQYFAGGILILLVSHNWFRIWFIAHLTPSHYLNQYWLIKKCAGNYYSSLLTPLMLDTEYLGFGVNTMPVDALAPKSCQSISRHGIGCLVQTTCIVVPELSSSTWAKPTPRYDSKCEYISFVIFTTIQYVKSSSSRDHCHPFSMQVQILVVVDSHFCALNDKLLICATQKDRTTWNISTGKYSSSRNI